MAGDAGWVVHGRAVLPVALAIAVVAVVVAAALGVLRQAATGALYPSAWPAPSPVRWHGCDTEDLRAALARCATIRMPLDWAHPDDGEHVAIAIAEVRHTAARYDGLMVTLQGGPGFAGRYLAEEGSNVPDGVGAHYDWIGIDDRGTGDSRPLIACGNTRETTPEPWPEHGDGAAAAALTAEAAGEATRCAKDNGPLLAHMRTTDVATDVDYLRAALGAQQVSLYGWSAGAGDAGVYATLFPDRVRRLVMDSTPDLTTDWYHEFLATEQPREANRAAFFTWTAGHDDRYHLGRTAAAVTAAYLAEQRRLAAHPLYRVFGAGELADTMFDAGVYESTWPDLAAALSDLVELDDPGPMVSQWRDEEDIDDPDSEDAYYATVCSESGWPRAFGTWIADAARQAPTAPDYAWNDLWALQPCRTWRVPSAPRTRIGGPGTPAGLMIEQTLDGITPYAGSVAVRRRFPHLRLLAEPGGRDHADTLSGDLCVDRTIARYLDRGTLPGRRAGDGPDATCAPLPTPSPGA